MTVVKMVIGIASIRRFSSSWNRSRNARAVIRIANGPLLLRMSCSCKHDGVVAPQAELERQNGRDDGGGVVGLAHDAEHPCEDGILRVDGGKPVIAAFVRVYDKV